MSYTSKKIEYSELIHPINIVNESLDTTIENESQKLNKMDFAKFPTEFVKSKLNIIGNILKQTFNLIQISKISKKKLAIKNEFALHRARKNLYFIVQHFEDIVGNDIDIPFSDNKKSKAKFFEGILNNLERVELFKKVGFLTNTLNFIYGETNKWKWNFVNLEGRIIIALKNSVDMRKLIKDLDPATKEYSKQMDLINLILEKTNSMAENYRKKYELTNKHPDDMKMALAFLSLRQRLVILLGINKEAEITKKKINIWSRKLNEDIKLKETV